MRLFYGAFATENILLGTWVVKILFSFILDKYLVNLKFIVKTYS